MKFKKTLLAFCLIMCIFFCVSSVAAGDVNDTLVASEDQNVIENQDSVVASEATAEVDNEKIENDVISSSNEEILNAKDNGTFTALQEKINDAGKGSTVTLDDDYAYDDGFAAGEISIGKSLTVDGKGHIIDCKNKSRAFNLDADGITLKNIIFKNGQSAIYSLWDNNIGIMNCSFINCSASSDDPFGISGGIIHLSGSNCIISESNFIGCSVSANGYVEGGIVCIRGSNSTISESNFIGCSVSANEYVDGGIIYFRGNNNAITNSEFIDSSISSSNDYIRGGAVSFRGLNNKVFKSRFINSRTSAHGMGYVDGGVIEFFDGEDNIISDSVFADCKLESSYYINGGVVSAFGSNINVTRSNFTGCFAKSSGGCIDFAGGVIYIRGGTYSNITESRFINCLSSLSNCPKEERFCIGGGVIYTAWTSDCIVSKSSFIGCTVQIDSSTYANGGAVYFDSGVENMISDSRFENCSLKGTSPHVSSLVTSSDDLSAYKVCDSSFDGCGGYNILIDAKYKNCTIRNCPTVKIVGISVKNLNVVYGSGVKCMITVSENYAPAKDVSVVVSINGKKFTTIKTDSKGVASFKISQAPGTYKLTLTASGKSVSKTMTVKKATPKLTANAKSFKKSVKTKKYTVTLKTNQNKVMKNTKVTLKVNGKTYSAKTNAKGVAKFTIKLTKKGKYTAKISFAGDKTYSASNKSIKVTIK